MKHKYIYKWNENIGLLINEVWGVHALAYTFVAYINENIGLLINEVWGVHALAYTFVAVYILLFRWLYCRWNVSREMKWKYRTTNQWSMRRACSCIYICCLYIQLFRWLYCRWNVSREMKWKYRTTNQWSMRRACTCIYICCRLYTIVPLIVLQMKRKYIHKWNENIGLLINEVWGVHAVAYPFVAYKYYCSVDCIADET